MERGRRGRRERCDSKLQMTYFVVRACVASSASQLFVSVVSPSPP